MHMTSCQLLYHTLSWSYTNQEHIPIHMTPFQLTYFMSLILVRNILYHRRFFFSRGPNANLLDPEAFKGKKVSYLSDTFCFVAHLLDHISIRNRFQ